METETNTFKEILYIHKQHHDELKLCYQLLNRILTRIILECTSEMKTDFTHISSRMHALCKIYHFKPLPLQIFRANSRKIQTGEFSPSTEDYRYDLKAVCEAISRFIEQPIPKELSAILPTHWRNLPNQYTEINIVKKIRITVSNWDDTYIYGLSEDFTSENILKICYNTAKDSPFVSLNEQLYVGAQINLLSVKINDNNNEEIILEPELLILDPDFLIDITSICACIKPYGTTAYTHLINKFSSEQKSAAIQLGNAANLFLDDCVNENNTENKVSEKDLYLRSMQKSFRESPLEYSTLEGIDYAFFEQCEKQFHNIREVVKQGFSAAEIDIEKSEVQLEPSFICEALGIQGRMDLLVNNLTKLIELKSGKANEYPHTTPKEEHKIQMALYKEILYYNMNQKKKDVESYLFYSRYPKFYAIEANRSEIQHIMALRNDIVDLERRLRNGSSMQIFQHLDESAINVNGRNDRFYNQWLKPQIMQIVGPLSNMEELESKYFHTFLAFLEREQFIAKTGDNRPDSGRGFSELWNSDTLSKIQNGNILIDLKISPIHNEENTVIKIKAYLGCYEDDFLPNFRQGDAVMLYERNNESDNITNKQIFRCLIEEIHPEWILLKLSFKQRNSKVFNLNNKYAIEPAYFDSTFNQMYAGLFELITAPKKRKDLILGRREPETDTSRQLNRHYLNDEIDKIVLKAKQAKDYFLLVGPPGTGKTSVALKSMVEEFISEEKENTILLMAYTNRAVDEICEMLSTINPEPEYIRIGQELNCDKKFRKHMMKNIIGSAINRKEIYECIRPVNIFVGTISSICGNRELFALKHFDIALIDEASQVLEPQLLPLLCAKSYANKGDFNIRECAINKFILIGDHKQLPAVVAQNINESLVNDKILNDIGLFNCRNSFFERLHTLQREKGYEGITAMLHRQGRMHPELCNFVNRKYYDNKLDIVPVEHQTAQLEFKIHNNDIWERFVSSTRIGLVNVIPQKLTDNHKCNQDEANAVAKLVYTISELCKKNKLDNNIDKKIGIIVPFRGQIAMIRKSLEPLIPNLYQNITIDTVERYQGSQRDIIIFSTTITQTYQLNILSEPVISEGISIDRKLNVALTRARKQFFLIGNKQLLYKCKEYRELIEDEIKNELKI